MENDKEPKENAELSNGKKTGGFRFYAAVVAEAAAAVFWGLSFLERAGIYFLIASVLLEIAALSFLSVRGKAGFAGAKILRIIAYILLFLSAALFLGGLIYSAAVG